MKIIICLVLCMFSSISSFAWDNEMDPWWRSKTSDLQDPARLRTALELEAKNNQENYSFHYFSIKQNWHNFYLFFMEYHIIYLDVVEIYIENSKESLISFFRRKNKEINDVIGYLIMSSTNDKSKYEEPLFNNADVYKFLANIRDPNPSAKIFISLGNIIIRDALFNLIYDEKTRIFLHAPKNTAQNKKSLPNRPKVSIAENNTEEKAIDEDEIPVLVVIPSPKAKKGFKLSCFK